jgi:broad specificity phosphatase PhoE
MEPSSAHDPSATTLYLIRHGATAMNLAQPAQLQGRGIDAVLAPEGIRQAEATRDFLRKLPIRHCYSSPLRRAVETATIVAGPHGVEPITVSALTECDVGRWEGLDWDTIRSRDPDAFRRYMDRPGEFGYPEGESFSDVQRRTAPALEKLLARHPGQCILVVGHHVVNRVYLAGLLGLSPNEGRRVSLDNCGISVVERRDGKCRLVTLNAVFHLHAWFGSGVLP